MSIKDSPASRRATASWRWWCVSFGLRPMTTPPRFGALSAFAGATADQFSLELGKAAQDGQHQSAMRRGRIGPGILQ